MKKPILLALIFLSIIIASIVISEINHSKTCDDCKTNLKCNSEL